MTKRNLLGFAAVEWSPRRLLRNMPQEILVPKAGIASRGPVRQLHVVIGEGFVECRAADLDHFETGRAFEDPVADAGRLEGHVAGRHDEWLSLILIDNPDPTAAHDDELKRDAVEMHPVGNWSSSGIAMCDAI